MPARQRLATELRKCGSATRAWAGFPVTGLSISMWKPGAKGRPRRFEDAHCGRSRSFRGGLQRQPSSTAGEDSQTRAPGSAGTQAQNPGPAWCRYRHPSQFRVTRHLGLSHSCRSKGAKSHWSAAACSAPHRRVPPAGIRWPAPRSNPSKRTPAARKAGALGQIGRLPVQAITDAHSPR
jgi:hypothetical protein